LGNYQILFPSQENHAASVNAADWKVRTGGSLYVQAQFPHVLGRDFSGVVSAVGEGVAGFRPAPALGH
jgi:NADPH:quinone reductase-like Zn-dependent oxidoreductase